METILLRHYVDSAAYDLKLSVNKGKLSKALEKDRAGIIRNTINSIGQTPVTVAIFKNDLETLKFLLSPLSAEAKFDLIQDADGLHAASAKQGFAETLSFLLENLTPQQNELLLKRRNCEEQIPLHFAVRYNRLDTVKIMIKTLTESKRFELLKIQSLSGNTALHIAARLNHAEILKFLLESAPTTAQQIELLSIEGGEGNLPIDCAAKHRYPDTLRNIFELIPEQELYQLLAVRKPGRNPTLHFPALAGYTETVRYILKRLKPENRLRLVSMSGQVGFTAVDAAASRGHVDTIMCMVNLLSKVQQTYLVGEVMKGSFLNIISQRNSSEIEELLEWLASVEDLHKNDAGTVTITKLNVDLLFMLYLTPTHRIAAQPFLIKKKHSLILLTGKN